jgi:NAD(P)H-nitrite reductase large subunit
LIDAIRKGATTLYEIQMETQATTGCGGCEYEVLDLLEELLKPDAGPGAL